MNIRILGCSGGIGVGLATTSMAIDDDILIDGGTGLAELTLDEMSAVRHIFLTHSHLDHIAGLPMLVDSIFERIHTPIVVHGRPETLAALREHVFNWMIWPDFSKLPNAERPVMRFEEIRPGQVVELEGRRIEAIEVNHVVPCIGYRIEADGKAFAFSADTTTTDHFWEVLNGYEGLDLLVAECAFPNRELALSRMAYHYCPQLLAADLVKLRHRPRIYLSHPKPGMEQEILDECKALIPDHDLRLLSGGRRFTL